MTFGMAFNVCELFDLMGEFVVLHLPGAFIPVLGGILREGFTCEWGDGISFTVDLEEERGGICSFLLEDIVDIDDGILTIDWSWDAQP